MTSLVADISVEEKLLLAAIKGPEKRHSSAECPFCLLITDWLSYCKMDGLSNRTLADYRNKINKFEWWWSTYYSADLEAHPRNVTTKQARAFAAYLRESKAERWGQPVVRGVATLSEASVGSYGCAIKALFNWLEREKEIEQNPFNRSVKFSSRNKVDHTISTVPIAELSSIIQYLTELERFDTFGGKRDLAIFTLLIDTGIRRGELLSITVETMSLTTQLCTVKGKTGKRVVPFSAACQKVLEVYYSECVRLFGVAEKESLTKKRDKKAVAQQPHLKEAKKEDSNNLKTDSGQVQQAAEDISKEAVDRVLDNNSQFWLTNEGTPLTYYGFSSVIRRIKEGSGVDFHAHELRHTYATLMIKQGVNLIDLKHLMGHASVTTTEIYTHRDIAHLAEVQAPNSPLLLLHKLERSAID